jgi:carbohydrate esterase-like sialic acid-specific acetylesterase
MGNGLDLDGADAPHPRVHQWARCGPSKGTAVVGVDPLFHDVRSKGVGFGVTFAKQLADATGRWVLLVPASRGDTAFTPKNGYTWDPVDRRTRVNLYRDAVGSVDEVLSRHPGSEVAAVLWHQGETDVPLMSARNYQGRLDFVIDDLRTRYGARVPVIVGGMVPEEMERGHRRYPLINAVHEDTPNRKPRTAFVPGPRDSYNSDIDRHYSGAGLRELGRRMWDAYRTMAGDELAEYAAG